MGKSRHPFNLLVLSQNMVTVLFIMIEIARFTFQDESAGQILNLAFVKFSDKRESRSCVMLTHLFLLLGISVPYSLTYIILDGGFPDSANIIFSASALIFLGVGDTVAAIAGSYYGEDKWRPGIHNKSR